MNKIIFFGTPDFAAQILKYLFEIKQQVIAIVTQPDKAQKRSSIPVASPVKVAAKKFFPNARMFQPEKASDPDFIESIKNLSPDLFLVVAYGQILKKKLLDIPTLAPLNVHASLLPKYRGAAPIQKAIMEGEPITGISLMRMDEKMDAGDVYIQKSCEITTEDTFSSLEKKLCNLSKEGVKEILDLFALPTPPKGFAQDHLQATYAGKITKEMCKINWNKPAKEIFNLIRALSPKPCAFTYVKTENMTKKIKILYAKYVDLEGLPGTVVQEIPLVIACEKGSLQIEDVQPENKKIMKAVAWVRGMQSKKFSFV